MSSATALAAAKAALFVACQSLYPDPAVVSYGMAIDDADELVEILDGTILETEDVPLSNLRRRDFMFTLTGVISVYRGGGPEVQQTVTERALAMLGALEDWLQDSGTVATTHVGLGGAVRFARVSSHEFHELDGTNDDEDISTGRTTAVAFVVSGKLRA